jgi:hypothetical protein
MLERGRFGVISQAKEDRIGDEDLIGLYLQTCKIEIFSKHALKLLAE